MNNNRFAPTRIIAKIWAIIGKSVSDRIYLQIRYLLINQKWFNVCNPKTFTEKLNWLKIYYRDPIYTSLVDKIDVKSIVAETIGPQYLIPTLGVWNTFDEIDFDILPAQFVLKNTNGGGGAGVYICKDKCNMDIESVRKKLEKSTNSEAKTQREWPYYNVKKRYLAEEYMSDLKNSDLIDYKFFCFNGIPRLCQVISDRNTDERIDFYDMDWNRQLGLIGLNIFAHNSDKDAEKPQSFETMKQIAAKLSANIPFVRVDLYEINGKCYFGEITFFPQGGFGLFKPEEWNSIVGDWLTLPPKNRS